MKKPMMTMLVCLAILFGIIFIYKSIQVFFIKKFLAKNKSPIITISALKIDYSSWQPQYIASGSLRAVLGVNVTTEAAGMVKTIAFKPGAMVKKDALLVQLNTDPDVAQLHSLQASNELAETTYKRDKAQYAIHAVSKATLDTDAANLKNSQAEVAKQIAVINEKTLRAPFAGRLGICQVNPGQYIHPGDTITSLQTLNPIYADFYAPQSELPRLQTGELVTLKTDSYPGQEFAGKITTIDSSVNSATRNVEVEATITNPKAELTPGMFATVIVDTGTPQRYLTLPQTAISFNSYGEIAYVLKPTEEKDQAGNQIFTAKQTFVTTGATRADQIAILQGLQAGDLVVTSGQLKLKNGSRVIINNSAAPANDSKPDAQDKIEE